MSMHTVAILDDHALFRTGIQELFSKSDEFSMLFSAGTPQELYEELGGALPDVLLLDIRLKEDSGLDVLQKIKQKYPEVKVVMLTMHRENSYIRQMVEQGADGYLLKDIAPEELFSSLRHVMTLGKYYGPEVTSALVQSLQHKESLKQAGITFSEPELEVLKMISDGMTADEISKKVFKSSRTIEGYRQKLMEKTDSKNVVALISWAFKNGVL